MSPFLAFVLGLLIGWLVEWVIDWIYWRRKWQALQAAADQCRQERQALQAELAELKPKPAFPGERAAPEIVSKPLDEAAAGPAPELRTGMVFEPAGFPGAEEPTDSVDDSPQGKVTKPQEAREGTVLSGEAARLVEAEVIPPSQRPDDLIVINGIGPVIARMLNQAGIYTFEQLAELTPDSLREILGDVIKRLADEESLIEQARQLALQKKGRGV